MGCDIHSVAQVKMGGKWTTVGEDVAGDNRNYDTFGILADVRNGSGFAGCDTGDGYEPISEPKGFPEDFEIDEDSDDYHNGTWMGDHSHSWHTLEDIEKYLERVKNRTTKKRGCVSEKQYLELRGTNKSPDCYSGWTSGPNLVVIPAKEYDRLEAAKDLPKNKRIEVQYEWTVSYTDATYIDEIVSDLRELAEKYKVNHDEVRYVFGFDS